VDRELELMNIWAIVPVKPFIRAKSRLAAVLQPQERQALAEKMFRHSIEVLVSVRRVAGVLVISRDTKALAIARDYGVHTVQESGAPELNAALLRASQVVGSQGADGVLVLPADVPMVAAEDIEQILHLGRYNTTVVLAPDGQDDGTNALLCNPPGYIPFSYGPGSFHRHLALAEEAGATVKIYRSERLSLDIDTPPDLDHFQHLTSAAGSLESPANSLSIAE
jgi:2-phospho-L-lactate/phosphoenolpyruvate guanylyltransferase